MRGKVLAWAMVALGLMVGAPAARADLLFEVNRTNDLPDTAVGDHACDSRPTLAGDQCTLRAVIQETNMESGFDGIDFNIPGPGVKTIAPSTPLPAITGPVEIDGYTQGLAHPNTKGVGQGDDAILLVELSGENTPFGTTGLALDPGASGSVIKGLVINRFSTGLLLKANSTIQGNFIGTSPGGKVARPNSFDAIFTEPANVQIGGATAAARNLISGNGRDAINGTGDVNVQGNFIGTQRDGASPLPNVGSGIELYNSNNTIGGARANVIAFNAVDGITMFNTTQGNSVLGNRIFSNGNLGIDLGGDGPTPNDAGDADTGANQRQNFPTIFSATRPSSGGVDITGRLNSTPSQNFTIEFFRNPPGDEEGSRLIGRFPAVTTNASGFFNFSAHFASPVAVGDRITATATNASGSTSEFSRPRTVVAE